MNKYYNAKIEQNYLARIESCQPPCYPEEAHMEADKILTDLLTDLGYKKLVEQYDKVPKWYS